MWLTRGASRADQPISYRPAALPRYSVQAFSKYSFRALGEASGLHRSRDSIEAMLAAQMGSVHVAAMRSALRLALTETLQQREGITRALTRLARTFAAQIEALGRHRDNGERSVTVQNVSVQDGGSAIVGNVTQHASVIVAEADAANPAATEAVAGRERHYGKDGPGVERGASA